MSLNLYKNASSRRRCSFKKAVLNIFAKSKEKHLYWSLFSIKLQAQATSLLEKRLQHICFSGDVFENNLLIEHLRTAASTNSKFLDVLKY